MAAIVFVVIIAVIGVSEMGEMAIGGKGSISGYANATTWAAYNTFGFPLVLLISTIVVILFSLMVYALSKT